MSTARPTDRAARALRRSGLVVASLALACGSLGATACSKPNELPDSGASTDATPLDSGQECQTAADCLVPTAPICGPGGECEGCQPGAVGDEACGLKDAATPRCAANGACVECLDSAECFEATKPVCDRTSNVCRPCEDHSECDDSVCARASGTCVGAADIIYVSVEQGADGVGCGTWLAPCASVSGAEGALVKVAGSRNWIRLAAGVYPESLYIGDTTVNLVGETGGDASAEIVPSLYGSNWPGIEVIGGTGVLVDSLMVRTAIGDTNADGIRCIGPTAAVTVVNSEIFANSYAGIIAGACDVTIKASRIFSNGFGVRSQDNGSLTIERSRIEGNGRGGLWILDSAFVVRNSFIVDNGVTGDGGSIFGGALISASAGSPAPRIFEFNTVAGNSAQAAAYPAGVSCFSVDPATVGNNIVYFNEGEPGVGAGCDWTYSNIEGGQAGTGNIAMDPQFVNMASGDVHIEPTSPCRDSADPDAAEAVDFDGQARGEGGRSDMGADEVMP